MQVTDKDGSRVLTLSIPAISTIAGSLSVVLFLFGFVSGYMTFRSEMAVITAAIATLNITNNQLQQQLSHTNDIANENRQAISIRLTSVETDIKYITSGIAELKLRNAGK